MITLKERRGNNEQTITKSYFINVVFGIAVQSGSDYC